MPDSTQDWIMDYVNGNAGLTGDNVDLHGLNTDPTIRFTGAELAQLDLTLSKYLPAADRCIIGQVAGGALEESEFWFWESSALSAQAYCKTDVTFDSQIAILRQKSPILADLIVKKTHAATTATKTHYQNQKSQDKANTIGAIAGKAAEAEKKLESTASDVLNIAPRAAAVALVGAVLVVAAVAAIVYLPKK